MSGSGGGMGFGGEIKSSGNVQIVGEQSIERR